MDLFLAGCQGLGLAIAFGMFAGALAGVASGGADGNRIVTVALLAVASVGGALACGASLRTEDHPAWPGWVVGAAVAAFALFVVGGVVSAAAGRAREGGSAGGIAAITGAAALILAALSFSPASPISLFALACLVYLAIARRRRAAEKYEGLRILRG